jgi:hypothetical protein
MSWDLGHEANPKSAKIKTIGLLATTGRRKGNAEVTFWGPRGPPPVRIAQTGRQGRQQLHRSFNRFGALETTGPRLPSVLPNKIKILLIC